MLPGASGVRSAGAGGRSAGGLAADYVRLLHPLPSLLTMVASGAFVLLAAEGVPPATRLALLLAVEAARQFSISAYNDYYDRRVDAGRAGKPVASGAISARTAWAVGCAFGLLSLLLAYPFGLTFTALTAVGLLAGLMYDAGLKYTALSWLPFSIAFPTLPLWAWAGVTGQVPSRLLWVLPAGAVLVLGIHLADTLPDIAADSAAGVRGLAHRLGETGSVRLCWAAFGGGALVTAILAPVADVNLAWYLPGLAAGVALALGGAAIYLRDAANVRAMSLLVEMGTMLLAVGWVAGLTR